MNIFVIPSWYPSSNDPLTGIFIKEQVVGLAKQLPQINFGVSLWGSHERELMLNALHPFSNIRKLVRFKHFPTQTTQESPNLTSYFDPALTWTRRIKGGNIKAILDANERNLNRFKDQYSSIDLIHSHVGHPGGYIGMELSKKYEIPFIISENMSPFPFKTFLKGSQLSSWISAPYAASYINVAPSQLMADQMSSFGIDRIKVVPNYTDGQNFQLQSISKVRSPFTFLSIGRLVDYKGFEELIEAFSVLQQSSKEEVLLRIIGDGPMRNLLMKKCSALGLDDKVIWLGNVNRTEVREEMASCDAFVLTSRVEPFGIVYTEALSCGKPIVATQNGGALDIINNKNGVLAEIKDSGSIASAMEYLMAHRDRFNPLAIREDFELRFGEKVIAEKTLMLYSKAIGSHKSM